MYPLKNYSEIYESVWTPFSRHICLRKKFSIFSGVPYWDFRFDIVGLLFNREDGLFRRNGWSRHWSPSYYDGFKCIIGNIIQFLTPWYRPRRNLLRNLYERNESKLLSSNRKSCYFRNRRADTRYFDIRFGFLFGMMTVTRYVDTKGSSKNLFVSAVTASLIGEEPENLHEEVEVVIKRMPVLTRHQCQAFFDTAVEKTRKYMEWYT